MIYFIFYNVYVTCVYEFKTLYPKQIFGLDIAFLVLNAIFVCGFAFIEIRQVIGDPLDYFSSFWNIVDITSVGLNAAFIICDAI